MTPGDDTATAGGTTAGLGAENAAGCGVSAAVTTCADPVLVESSDDDDPDAAPAWSMTLCTWVAAAATKWRESVNGLAADGVGSGDVAEVVDVTTSVELAESTADGVGVLPGLAVVLGVVADDAAGEGVLGPVVADGLAPPWGAFFIRNDPRDDVLCGPPDSCVEAGGPLDVPVVEVLAPEPVLLLDEEPPASGPVPSAWAIPEPLARAAPRPRVIAPAPSQPWATRGSG